MPLHIRILVYACIRLSFALGNCGLHRKVSRTIGLGKIRRLKEARVKREGEEENKTLREKYFERCRGY